MYWTRQFGPPVGPFEINRDSMQAAGLIGWWPTLPPGIPRDRLGGRDTALTGLTLTADPDMGWVLVNAGAGTASANAIGYPVGGSGSPVTVSAWCRPTGQNAVQAIVARWGIARYDYGIYLVGTNNRQPAFYYATTSGVRVYSATATAQITPNAVIHLCGVYVGNTTGSLYVNGRLVATGIDTMTRTSNAASLFTIGSNSDGTPFGYRFYGGIGDIRIYNLALSPDEVYQLYAPQTRWELYRPAAPRWWSIPSGVIWPGIGPGVIGGHTLGRAA